MTTPTARKGEGHGRAALLQREGKVTAGVALVQWRHCHYVHRRNNGQNGQSLNLLQCSLRSPWQR